MMNTNSTSGPNRDTHAGDRRRSARLAVATALAWALMCPAPAAHAYSPIPAYPGPSGVATSGVAVDPEPIRALLASHRSTVDAKYTVLFVEYSDRLDRPGADYGDSDQAFIGSVVDQWGARADTQSSIFIVVSMSNRDIIVHPFSRFAALGWEQQAVKATIDASPFGLYARSGDYAQAILSLVIAIDAELEGRIERARSSRLRLETQVTNARQSVARFEARAAGSRYRLDDARQGAAEMLASARAAEQAIARRDWEEAASTTRHLAIVTRRLDASIDRLDETDRTARRRLVAITRERERLAREPRVGDSTEFLRDLHSADDWLGRSAAKLAAGDPNGAIWTLGKADRAIDDARTARTEAMYRFRLWYRVVPSLVLLGLLAGILSELIARRRRVVALRAEAEPLLASLEKALGHASDKLVDLENEHALFLSGGVRPTSFTGASEAPVREAAARVDVLFLEFEAAMRVARDARAFLAESRLLDVATAERALRTLTTDEVVVRTEQVQDRKLLLPDHREVRRRASELSAVLEGSYASALQALEGLGARIGAVHDAVLELSSHLTGAASLFEAAARRTPIGDSRTARDALEADRTALCAKAKHDPIGCEPSIAELTTRIAAFESLARGVDEASVVLTTTLPSEAASVVSRVATLRTDGVLVHEPALDPDAALDEIVSLRLAAIQSLASGEFEAGISSAQRAAAKIEDLVESIDGAEEARRTYVPKADQTHDRLVALRTCLEGRRQSLNALRGLYTETSLMPAIGELAQAPGWFAKTNDALARARESLAPERQHYLGAKRLVDGAIRTLDRVDALYAEIDDKAGDLAMMVVEIDADLAAAPGLLSTADALATSCEQVGRPALGATLPGLRARLAEFVAMRATSPIAAKELWAPAEELVQQASLLNKELERALAELRGVVRLRDEAVANAARLRDSLAGSADDRAEANAVFVRASTALAGVVEGWAEIIQQPARARAALDQAGELLEQARTLAAADYDAAQNARLQVGSAQEAIRDAQALVPGGAPEELRKAQDALAEAQAALREQRYTTAASVASSVNASVVEFSGSVRRTQAREAERRRRKEELAEERRIRRSQRSSHSSSFGSSGGSDWSSSSASWGASSSSRSERSSSGSSSFGSSSGSSSFGSSSGSSKW